MPSIKSPRGEVFLKESQQAEQASESGGSPQSLPGVHITTLQQRDQPRFDALQEHKVAAAVGGALKGWSKLCTSSVRV